MVIPDRAKQERSSSTNQTGRIRWNVRIHFPKANDVTSNMPRLVERWQGILLFPPLQCRQVNRQDGFES